MFGENGRFFVFLLICTFLCDRTSSECTQLTPCSCEFADGQGYTLSQLDNSSYLTASTVNHTFYYHPCTNIRFSDIAPNSSCSNGTGASLCIKTGNATYDSLGTVEETKIIYSESFKEPLLKLNHGVNETTIVLNCCSMCKTQLVVNPDVNDKSHQLVLMSPYACKALLHKKILSTGSVLVILFSVFTGLYLIGGAIILKLLRGATGWEMMPNYQFWRELSSLVRDGIAFTFNCCRVDSYNRI